MRGHLPITAERARHLYLTGFMGSGKTTIGRALATRLGWDFVDLDHEVARQREMSLQEIFETEGEAMFRRWENEAFAAFAYAPQPLVLSTGGGTLIDPTNFDLAHRTGLTIYLIVDFPTVLRRLTHGADRPLYDDGDPVTGRDRLQQLYHHRLPFYRMADFHIDGVHGEVPEIVERIWATLPALCTS